MTAEVDYNYFVFSNYMEGFRIGRNLLLILFLIPTGIYYFSKREERSLLN